jgi:predicted nucleotidyltransferase
MFKHHAETIDNILVKLRATKGVQAVLLGGSIAHGFESKDSDVDIMIVVSDEEHEGRLARSDIMFYDLESCTYPGGYIDGKYISPGFMRLVARKGSEPARFAFQGAKILWSEIDSLRQLLEDIVVYPVQEKAIKIHRFRAQLDAWQWYCHEAIRKQNRYLLNHSVSNVILFGGRLILALNETFYPYHKWFLRVLSSVPLKPDGLMADIGHLLNKPTSRTIDQFCKVIIEFVDWGCDGLDFANDFVLTNELNWISGNTPIADA